MTTQEILNEIQNLHTLNCNINPDIIIRAMQISRLDRIAEALESLGQTADSIEQSLDILSCLVECTDKNDYGRKFCITGGITRYEP